MKIVLKIIANSVDPDEIPHYIGFHCLPKYLFGGFQYIKGKISQLLKTLNFIE